MASTLPSVRCCRGAALLEFAVVLPVLLFLCIWVGSLGFAISQLVWLSEASYAAVMAGAEDRSTSASTAEGLLDELFASRHSGKLEGSVVLSAREAEVRNSAASSAGLTDAPSSDQAPLIALSVDVNSRPLAGFLPSVTLSLETVISQLTVGGAVGDFSEPGNINGACPGDDWVLPCGNCNTSCSPGGGNNSNNGNGGGNPGKGKGGAPSTSSDAQQIGNSYTPNGGLSESAEVVDPSNPFNPASDQNLFGPDEGGGGSGEGNNEPQPTTIVPPLPNETEQNWY